MHLYTHAREILSSWCKCARAFVVSVVPIHRFHSTGLRSSELDITQNTQDGAGRAFRFRGEKWIGEHLDLRASNQI